MCNQEYYKNIQIYFIKDEFIYREFNQYQEMEDFGKIFIDFKKVIMIHGQIFDSPV